MKPTLIDTKNNGKLDPLDPKVDCLFDEQSGTDISENNSSHSLLAFIHALPVHDINTVFHEMFSTQKNVT